jgi:hypothetical protein
MGVHVPQRQAAQIGLETTPGTAVTATLELPLVGDLITPTQSPGHAEVRANWSFPSATTIVPTGVAHRFGLSIACNINVVRDLVLLSAKDHNGDLPYFTLVHKQADNGLAQYAGCQVMSLTLSVTRGREPGEDIWLASLVCECMSMTEGSPGSYASLTAPTGRHFQLRHSTITINSTAVPLAFGTSIAISNNLAAGPVNSSNVREYLKRGPETLDISVSRAFATLALKNLVAAQTEAATNSIVLATGTANETVTFTMGKLQLGERGQGVTEDVVSESVPLRPYHTGSAHQLVPTFGSSIGASALSL